MKKNSSLKIPGGYMFRKKITPWCILALPMAFTIWLKYYPIFSAFFISLFRYDPINPPGQFAGLQNYIGMFGMQHYWDAWKNTFIFLLLQISMCFFIPLIQALLLNELIRLLLYLSAIQGVSPDIMESASLDGCTGFGKILHIILPNISFMIFIQLIMAVITTMQLLDAPYMYASGGPSGASTTQGIFIYNSFNQDLNYGRGSAASVILLLVIAALTMLQMHFEKAEKE